MVHRCPSTTKVQIGVNLLWVTPSGCSDLPGRLYSVAEVRSQADFTGAGGADSRSKHAL